MYKDRITRWGLCKNIKRNEAVALIQRKAERDLMRKRTTIELHGQPVGLGRLLRHTKGERLNNTGPTVFSIPPSLQCKTPPPGAMIAHLTPSAGSLSQPWYGYQSSNMIPTSSGSLSSAIQLLPDIMMWSDDFNDDTASNSKSHTMEEDSQMMLVHSQSRSPIHGSSISRLLSPPTSLKVPDELFRTIKSHIDYTLQGGFPTYDRNGNLVKSIVDIPVPDCFADFDNHCRNAVQFKSKRSFNNFRRSLSKAFGLVPNILRSTHIRALEYFLDFFLYFIEYDVIEVTHFLRQHIAQMSASVIGDHVSWRRICRLLGTVEPEILQETAIRAWACNNNALRDGVGRLTESSLMAELSYIDTVYGLDSLIEGERLLRKLLSDFEEQLGTSSSLVMQITFNLGWNLFNQDKYVEAEILGEEVMAASQAENSELSLGIQVEALGLLADCQFQQGSFLSAEKNIRRTIKLIEQEFGMEDSWRLRFMITLEGWLRDWGRLEEADKLRLEMNNVIGLDETDLEAMQG